jgi:hypothetical protein
MRYSVAYLIRICSCLEGRSRSGSEIQLYGSADPDPYINVTHPKNYPQQTQQVKQEGDNQCWGSGSESISQRYGFGSGRGSFPFLVKC